MRKFLKRVAQVLGIIVIGFTFYIGHDIYERIEPFKVTDPNDSRFNPDEFEFDDYVKEREIVAALSHVFSIGMKKKEIEKILMEGGFKYFPNYPLEGSCYLKAVKVPLAPSSTFIVRIIYDESSQLQEAYWGTYKFLPSQGE